MTDQQQREQDAASAARWCGLYPMRHSPPEGCVTTEEDAFEPGDYLDESFGGALLVAAIKRKLVKEGFRVETVLGRFARNDGAQVRTSPLGSFRARGGEGSGPTELDAFLAVLRAMGKIGGTDD